MIVTMCSSRPAGATGATYALSSWGEPALPTFSVHSLLADETPMAHLAEGLRAANFANLWLITELHNNKFTLRI